MNDLNFLEETEYIFESSNSLINRRLDNVISNYELEYFENHYVKESSQNKFWESVKKFFAELILSFKKFTNMITLKVNTVINSGLKKRLHAKLEMERKKGTRTIEIIDMEKYKDTYLDMVSDLWTYGKRIERANYKTVDQIDRDLEKFNSIADKYDKKLDEIASKKVTYRLDRAIKFVENEINGKSKVTATLDEAMEEFNNMKNAAKLLETKRNILGQGIIPKHVNIIKDSKKFRDEQTISRWTKKLSNGIPIDSAIIKYNDKTYTFVSGIIKEDKDFNSLDEAEIYAKKLGYKIKDSISKIVKLINIIRR